MEELRIKLNNLISRGYKLTDSKVVQVSQRLDKYILRAQRRGKVTNIEKVSEIWEDFWEI